MLELKKEDFNKTFRFREARRGEHQKTLVNCVTCTSMSGGANDQEGVAYCNHPRRFRRIKIAEYLAGSWFSRDNSHNISSERVCDAYTSKPLPEGVELPVLPEKHVILLGSQWRDIMHADPNCPYVTEELRLIHEQENQAQENNITQDKRDNPVFNKPKISLEDRSDLVPMEIVGREICEMPCCDSKLPYQTWRYDSYRCRVGIKPDGSEPKIWTRNGIKPHEKKVVIQPEEIEAVFDLSRFNSPEFGNIHNRIIAVSEYLRKHSNRIGSRPLSEAVNPISLDSSYHILEDPLVGSNTGADVWVYDERLFNIRKGLEKPLGELKEIPEGIVPCMDTHKVFSVAQSYCREEHFGTFYIYGILKPLEDKTLLSKGLTHFIDIGAVTYHGHEHMWGEFGKGFNALASFHEE